jgi:hypothetical protein
MSWVIYNARAAGTKHKRNVIPAKAGIQYAAAAAINLECAEYWIARS